MRESPKPSRRLRGSPPWWVDGRSAVLALLLAVVVWVVAVYEQDPPQAKDFAGVSIQYTNIQPDLELVGTPVQWVNVTARAPKSHWALQPSPVVFEATADLSGLAEGTYSVDVKVRSLDRAATVVACSPPRVVVRLEQRLSREVPVHVQVADPETTPLGYATAEPKVTPDKVTVSGPRTAVEQVKEVVAKVLLRGSKTAIEAPVALSALNADGQPVNGVQISPAMATVQVEVSALAEFRDVTVRADVPGTPAAGYWVSGVTVEPATVTVQGRPEIIRQMASVVSTAPVDVTGVKESFSRRVALKLPEGVTVYSGDTSAQTVLVHVEVSPVMGGKTVQPKIQWLGLRSGNVVHISPDTIDVILSGPLPELQALQLEDVRVVVNLFGLAPGRYQLTPTVQLPEGSNLKVERFAPETVEVTISSTSARGSP